MKNNTLFLLISFLIAIACNKKETSDNFDKKGMFTHYADNLILPAYTTYQNSLINLETAVNTFTATPDAASLTNLQLTFKTAYAQWQYCEIYEKTDPANTAMAIDNINYYPTRTDSITTFVSRNENTITAIKSKNKNDKGFPAIEFLLFSRTGSNQPILDRFTTDAHAVSYKAYLTSLIAVLKEINTQLLTDWNHHYRSFFINNVGTDASGAFSVMVNSVAQRADDFKRRQIGIPAGYSGNIATANIYPNTVQGYYTKNSITYMLLTLDNLKNVMQGKGTSDGLGLYDYVKTLNISSTFGGNLADDIMNQIEVCKTKVNDCGVDFEQTLILNKSKADALFLEAKKLLVLIKVDLPSALGVSITYTDSDGD